MSVPKSSVTYTMATKCKDYCIKYVNRKDSFLQSISLEKQKDITFVEQ